MPPPPLSARQTLGMGKMLGEAKGREEEQEKYIRCKLEKCESL